MEMMITTDSDNSSTKNYNAMNGNTYDHKDNGFYYKSWSGSQHISVLFNYSPERYYGAFYTA